MGRYEIHYDIMRPWIQWRNVVQGTVSQGQFKIHQIFSVGLIQIRDCTNRILNFKHQFLETFF